MKGVLQGVGWPSGDRREMEIPKHTFFLIWRMLLCLTGTRLMTIRGTRGQKSLGAMHACVSVLMCLLVCVLIGLCVFGAEFERWKYVGGR